MTVRSDRRQPSASPPTSEDEREVSARRLIELLNEIRVAIPGVQILFAFLLTLPFTTGFSGIDGLDRDVYAIALIASALASILFISVAAEHRMRWRQGEKADIVDVSHQAMIWGLGFLAIGMTGAIFVVLRRVLGDVSGSAITVAVLMAFGWFWFALPLIRRR